MDNAYQQEVQLDTLYKTAGNGEGNGNSLQPFIEVTEGLINVYGSVDLPSSPPDDMFNATPDGFVGIENLGVIPNYMYLTQKSGTTTKIILSGVDAIEVE